jgi:hypothetical protein
MKISVGILVVNGRPFIEAQLNNLYDLAHEIVISEGGDKFWKEKHGHYRSNDGTIEIIKKYPDPQNKIKLIQRNWTNKNEMSHFYSRNMTGDIIYNVDIDEFMTIGDIKTVCKRLLKSRADYASVPHMVFFGDFDTILTMRHSDRWCVVPRIFKRARGKLMHHLPPGYALPSGKMTGCTGMPVKANTDASIYHYSWIYKKAVREKIAYYAFRIKDCIRPTFMDMFENFEARREQLIKDQINVRPTDQDAQYLKALSVKHPKFVEDIKKDLEILGNK